MIERLILYCFVIILLGTSPLIFLQTSIHVHALQDSSRNSDLTINIMQENTVIGYINVKVLKINDYPYDVGIDIVFDKTTIIKLTKSKNPSPMIVFKVNYTIDDNQGGNNYLEKYYDYYPISFYLSNILPASTLDRIVIRNMSIDYAFIGNNTIGGSINIYNQMSKQNMSTGFIKDLEDYALDFIKIVNDPGWYTYKLISGGRYIGKVEVISSHVFSNASSLRVYLEIYDRHYIDLINVSLYVYGVTINQSKSEFSKFFILAPGEDIIFPSSLGMASKIYMLKEIILNFSVRYYSKILNLTKDTGVILLSPQKEAIIFPLKASIISSMNLGSGWVEVKVGIIGNLDRTTLNLNYIPISGGRPIVIRCFLVRNYNYSYSYVLYAYLVFSEAGNHIGYLNLSDGRRMANLTVNFNIPDAVKNISVKKVREKLVALNLDQYLYLEISRLERVVKMGLVPEEEKMRYLERALYLKNKLSKPGNKNIYVIFIPTNNSLLFSSYYELTINYELTSLDITRPITIVIKPVYEDPIWQPGASFNETVFPLINGTTDGLIVSGPWIKKLYNELHLTLFNPFSQDLYKDAPTLVGFEIYFYNVESIKILNIDMSYIDMSSPSKKPSIAVLLGSGTQEEIKLLDLVIDNILILIIGTLVTLIIIIFLKRKS